MNINRHNYETYFLLYADNELPVTERVAVEQFVQDNIDVKKEFELIKSLILPTENILFYEKNILLKVENKLTDAVHYNLLLKVDGELNTIEEQKIDTIINTDETVKKAYKSLLQTKLSPAEVIIFKDKNLLYKKEKGRVVNIAFLRWAAAAIFIGFLFFIYNINSRKSNVETVVKYNTVKPIKPNTIINNNLVQPNVAGTVNNNAVVKTTTKATQTITKIETSTVTKQITKPLQKNYNNTGTNTTIVQIQTPKKPTLNTPIIIEDEQKSMAQNKPTINPNNTVVETIEVLDNGYTQALALTDVAKNENTILYMDEDAVKKTKIGVFFKKIKRIVQRTAHIKQTGNVSIAGFELAQK